MMKIRKNVHFVQRLFFFGLRQIVHVDQLQHDQRIVDHFAKQNRHSE